MASPDLCVSCDGALRRPKLLSCLHSVCSPCVSNIARDSSSVSCTKCGQTTQLRSVMFALPNDCISLSTSSIGRQRGGSSRVRHCDECADDCDATAVCSDCGLALCEIHARAHPISLRSRNHVVRALSECPLPEQRPAPRCPLHPNETLSLYCEVCSTSFCPRCREAGAHGGDGHRITEAGEAAELVREKLNALRSVVTDGQRVTSLSTAISEVADTIVSLNAAAEASSAEISQTVDSLVAALRRQERKLLDKLEELRWQKLQPLQAQLEDLEKRKLAAERVTRVSSVATSPESVGDEELLEISKWIHNQLQEAIHFSYKGRCADSFVAFVKQATQVEEAINNGLGCVTSKSVDCTQSTVQISSPSQHHCDEEVQLTVTTKNAEGKYVTGSLAELGLKVEVTDPHNVTHIVKETENAVPRPSSGSHTVSYTPSIVGEHKISIAIGDQALSGCPLSIAAEPQKLKFARNRGQLQNVSFQSDESITATGSYNVSSNNLSGSGLNVELCVVDLQDRVRLLLPLTLTCSGSFSSSSYYANGSFYPSLSVKVKAYDPGC